jgi:hypothetical protein
MANQLSDELRHGQRRAEEIRHSHGRHLNQEGQALIGEPSKFGLPQLLDANQTARRKTFARFLATSATSAQERERAERIGSILEGVDGSANLQEGVESLEQEDMQFISERLGSYGERLEIVNACAEHLPPQELEGLFHGNPNLQRLFTLSGNSPDAVKKALTGALEWAAAEDGPTFRSLYGLLENVAAHKSAEKQLSSAFSEKLLERLHNKHHIDLEQLRRHVDPAAPRADNIRRVREFLQASGMGVIRSWFGARRVDIVSNIVNHLTQNQEVHLQAAADVFNTLLANEPVFAGAVHEMVSGTAAAGTSEVLTKESYQEGKDFVDASSNRGTRTLSPELTQAYRDHLTAHGMTQNTDAAFQRAFLDDYYDENTRGHGFLSWLMGVLWSRKRNEITRSHLLNAVTV